MMQFRNVIRHLLVPKPDPFLELEVYTWAQLHCAQNGPQMGQLIITPLLPHKGTPFNHAVQ